MTLSKYKASWRFCNCVTHFPLYIIYFYYLLTFIFLIYFFYNKNIYNKNIVKISYISYIRIK